MTIHVCIYRVRKIKTKICVHVYIYIIKIKILRKNKKAIDNAVCIALCIFVQKYLWNTHQCSRHSVIA